jgi:hypothetical protein
MANPACDVTKITDNERSGFAVRQDGGQQIILSQNISRNNKVTQNR